MKRIRSNTIGRLRTGRWSFIACGAVVWSASILGLYADTHYVWKANSSPVSPFTNGWSSAATQIQDAVDSSGNGDVVLVTNGVYDTGGTKYGGITNRVCILSKSITLRAMSTNPSDTMIVGAPDMRGGAASNGPAATRCVGLFDYISTKVSGFTMTNGYTDPAAASAGSDGGGVFAQFHRPANGYTNSFSNCVILGCHALNGGGFYNGDYVNCSMIQNVSKFGGGGGYGAGWSVYSNCVFTGNIADPGSIGYAGGGFCAGTAYNCLIESNSSFNGGGCDSASAFNCIIRGNSASGNAPYYGGGGASGGTLFQNCLIVGNRSLLSKGAVNGTPLFINCTIVSNVSGAGLGAIGYYAGGFALTNCIVYDNVPNNIEPSRTFWISYSCVATGSVVAAISWDHSTTNNPMFVDPTNGNYRLASRSPCFNRGINQAWMTNAVDLDGMERICNGMVDMGAYEFWRPKGTIITILGSPAP